MRLRRITEMNPIPGPELKELLTRFWEKAEEEGLPKASVGQVSAYPTLTINGITLYTSPWEEIREGGNECNGAIYFLRDGNGEVVADFHPDLRVPQQASVAFFPQLSRRFGDDFRENIDQLRLEPDTPSRSP